MWFFMLWDHRSDQIRSNIKPQTTQICPAGDFHTTKKKYQKITTFLKRVGNYSSVKAFSILFTLADGGESKRLKEN